MEILKYCTDCDEIQFKEDGSWAPMRSKKEAQEVSATFNGVEGELTVVFLDYNSCLLIFSFSPLLCLKNLVP